MILLVGDVGGTKTTLALVSAEKGVHAPLATATLTSGAYASFGDLIADFFTHHSEPRPTHACLGVAGPVTGGRAKITNLPWVIDAAALTDRFGLKTTRLLNDLEATAYGVLTLAEDQRCTLREGQPVAQGTLAVIAPGTGLGKGFLTWDGAAYRAFPSEGGHAGFAPDGLLAGELLRELMKETDHVSWEWVLSGRGITRIYRFLRNRDPQSEPAWLAEALALATDPTPIIAQAGLDPDRPCPLCAAALDLFAALLGAAAGDFALGVLATGGVYIGGGIPPRVLPALRRGSLLEAFDRKGPMTELARRIPVHVVLDSQAALLGAASYGLRLA